ncbi:hypothetical protein AVEN_145115-1 [Araneus ventricosus]|uniref:Gustatory receptor n=1 Tax=Araneus ventricosus TaxID=182803 RepID=A0A4Y2JFA1_ARAVE|nr:hypothetical protein AVEN_145115-1 [Araneus ventricosus]
MWLLVKIRMEKIYMLKNQLNAFTGCIDQQICKKLLKISTVNAFAAVFIVFLLATARTLHYLMAPDLYHTCVTSLLSYFKIMDLPTFFSYQFINTYINSTPLYAVSLFYIMYCHTVYLCVCGKQLPAEKLHKLQKIFEEFENVFSLLVFIVFAHFLCRFLSIIFMFSYILKYQATSLIHSFIAEFIFHSLSVIALVLSADSLQCSMNEACKLEVSLALDSQVFKALDAKCFKILNRQEPLFLTGWGMFKIRKPLLLSLTTWLLTYAVIIMQFVCSVPNNGR